MEDTCQGLARPMLCSSRMFLLNVKESFLDLSVGCVILLTDRQKCEHEAASGLDEMTPSSQLLLTVNMRSLVANFTSVSIGADKIVGGSSLPDGIHPQKFPAKLWHLVNNPENKAICWNADGDAIIIDQNVFERQVVSQGLMTSDTTDAFRTTNFSNFVRQLKLYGFKKAGPAPKDSPQPVGVSGSCHQFGHPNFKRRHPELVASMQRMAVGSKAKPKAGVNRWPTGQTQQLSGCDDGEENEKTGESHGCLLLFARSEDDPDGDSYLQQRRRRRSQPWRRFFSEI